VVDVSNMPVPFTVGVYPGAGDTTKVEMQVAPGLNWQPLSASTLGGAALGGGSASAAYVVMLAGCMALRFTRTAGTGTDTYEVAA
jgi:hypothetical protein